MTRHMKASSRLLLAFLLLAFGAQSARAQFDTATVLGTVRDTNGAAVGGSTVTLKSPQTGIAVTTTTDASGDFQFLNVKVGTYEVTAERQGFATAVAEGVRVEVNARQRLDLSLQPGAITESVVVTDAASLLETETSVRGQVIGSRQVVNLPLNGRNYADLALLVPGVRESNLNQNSIASKRDASFNVNGLRSTYNNFLLDGIDNNSYGTSNQGFSSQVVQLSPDAVTEFKVETNNYSAEFGRSGGAVVNASLKSGTNAFHGSLWEFHRNTALNARGFFANRTNAPKPTLIRNQFGGALGGPIIRNRTFFFVDYEGFREVSSEVRFATVPTLAQRGGNLGLAVRNPITGEVFASGVIPQDRITPFARQVLADLPAPNLPGTANNFRSVAKNRFYNDKGDLKIDHRFNERVNAFVRASHRKANNFEAPTIPGPSGGDANGFVRVLNQQFAGGVTFTVSPTSLLEFRLGVSRTKAGKEPPLIGGASMNQLYGITGLPETPNLTGGLTAQLIGGFANLGRQATNPQFQNPTVVDPRVNYSWLMGRHSLKTGYEYQAINTEVNDVNPLYGRDGYGGQFSRVAGGANNLYNFADFLFGARSQYALVTPFVFDLRQRMHFLYVQDDFKVNNRLTLSLGLRYEYATPQFEANNRLSNYDPATNSIIAATDGSIAERALVEPDRNNFAPRAGLAFQIDEKTVVRAAYGIGYIHFNRSGGANLLPINGPQVVLAVIEQNPSQSSFRPTQAGYPAGLTDPSNFNPLTATVFHLPRDTRTGYVQSWHMTVQRELTKNTLLDVAYVGNHAVKLLLFGDLNQARPLRAGETLATASLQSRRPIGGFSAISTGFPVGFSNYHGLQMKFEHRASRGLYLLNSFTFSKALDNVAQSLEDPNGNSANPQNIRDLAGERGLSAYDQPVNNTTSVVYDLPLGRGRAFGEDLPAALDAFLGGWTLTAINRAESGQPINLRYNPTSAFAVTAALAAFQGGTSFRPNLIGDPLTPSGERTIDNYLNRNTVLVPTDQTQPFGSAGRNVARSNAFFQLDFGLHKSFALPMREDMRVELRAEAFNLLNKTNFRAADGNRSNASFGRITSAFPARQIQLALKLYF